jgi:1-acyl-sn-glycerol-3-phosphate acyltransferase
MTAAATPGAASGDEDSVVRGVLAIVRQLTAELHPGRPGVEKLDADASIERDFGLDSLARVELAARIEHSFSVALTDSALAESETARELARALVGVRGVKAFELGVPALAAVERVAAPAPESAETLLDALEWHAAEQPDRTHILLADRESDPEHISFGALRASATAVAAGLVRSGIRRGEAVAIMLPTGREFFAAFYGVLYARGVPVPLYPPARASQIEAHLRRVAGILANCEARVLLTFERARRLAHLLRPLNTRLKTIATIEEIAEQQAEFAPSPLAAGDTAFLQYTSGSTGQPKGVVLTHAHLLSNLRAMQRITGVTNSDCFVSWLPLYHDMGLIGACFGALLVGFPLVLMSPFTFLSHPVRWLRAVQRHRATITAAPNFAYEVCLGKIPDRELADLDLSSLRLVFNGAEAVSPQTVERFAERFGRCGLHRGALMPVYGLAECAVGLTFPPVGRGPLIDHVEREPFLRSGVARRTGPAATAPLSFVSCGKALPGYAARIVDERSTVQPERQQGRIEFQGPSATSGYFRNPKETARLFDGTWLDSGDLGYLADGELYVTGRAKDVIKRGGHNIHPQELEEAVALTPGIRKGGVAVFPATDHRSGTERIIVLAETRVDDPAVRTRLVADINRLAIDLIGLPVDEVVLAPPRTVLKTSSGKIRRAACRDAYEHGELGASGRGAWRQIVRLTRHGMALRVVRTARRIWSFVWGSWVVLVCGCLALPLWLAGTLPPGLQRRRRAAVAVVRLALALCGVSLQVRGVQPTAPGPRVYIANHSSYLDGFVMLAALEADLTFISKREFAGTLMIGTLFKRLGYVFVERHDVHEAASDATELKTRLQAAESLAIFPEGTFVRDPGVMPFHMGAFVAAAATGATVIPIAICGTRTMLPDGAVLPRPAKIEVIIGEALSPRDNSWRTAVELRARAREHIVRHVYEPDRELSPLGSTR